MSNTHDRSFNNEKKKTKKKKTTNLAHFFSVLKQKYPMKVNKKPSKKILQ